MEKGPRARTHQHASPSHIPGPLESQLAALMSKIVFIEQSNAVVSVTPEDYNKLTTRVKRLKSEKTGLQKRYEEIWALRDSDAQNNVRIRDMLAKTRRDLAAMTKLRDDDLANLQAVRSKLSEATRQSDKAGGGGGGSGNGSNTPTLTPTTTTSNGRQSPSRGRPGSMFMERRNTTDLFAAAQAAALQQRALELEKRNADLVTQIEALKGGEGGGGGGGGGGGANLEALNSLVAHQAWKEEVEKLEHTIKSRDAEISRLRNSAPVITAAPTPAPRAAPQALAGNGPAAVDFQRVEMLHEEHAMYRERMGGKLQALRSEKEALQRELNRREDDCHGLEVRVQSLQRRVGGL
ncbi:hypothetical protein P280DRAFT_394303 [Massarina eburnea CBS 473.64]|uniref:Uncharacterized protein n=1 Tax=Massarina eburnea CBS 473.64 TaxID=1395130 RepID=A0A6A6S7T6_9PLEO|nr:hypothetical protein P280DRAFT_394303 [Massarina eburnea CBS 473.64]